jgi:hypothetical protein
MNQPRPPYPQQPPRPPYRPPYDPAAVAAAKRRRGRILAAVLVPIGALFAIAVIVSASSDDDTKPAAAKTTPAYKVVDRKTKGHTRQITIEVNSTKDLRAVFDDSLKGLDENAGYTILINCSTGGTASVDNRLANGTYAVGNYGRATTGLDDGESKFEPVEGRHCPA